MEQVARPATKQFHRDGPRWLRNHDDDDDVFIPWRRRTAADRLHDDDDDVFIPWRRHTAADRLRDTSSVHRCSPPRPGRQSENLQIASKQSEKNVK